MRTLISPTYDENIPQRNKILAADGVMGVVVMLAYWGNGKNLFPSQVHPEFFVESKDRHGVVKIDVEGLTDLIGEVSKALGQEIGQLSISSLPIYLAALRRGQRANGNGEMVPVKTSYSRKNQELYIYPRNYEEDRQASKLELLPKGLIR